MEWLGLDYDGEVFYQSKHAEEHTAAAEKLIAESDKFFEEVHGKWDNGKPCNKA